VAANRPLFAVVATCVKAVVQVVLHAAIIQTLNTKRIFEAFQQLETSRKLFFRCLQNYMDLNVMLYGRKKSAPMSGAA
jgi:ethanolamine transporter EutH